MIHRPARHPSGCYWACPVNISGLDRQSVATLFEGDLFDLLRPTLAAAKDPMTALQTRRERGPISYGSLHDVVEGRVADLTRFLRQVRQSVDACPEIGNGHAPLKFRALSGDSHDGGKRPLIVEPTQGRWVLKFADPRPHHLLADILDEVSLGIGIDLRPPAILADQDHRWYFMPYLEPSEQGDHAVEAFMFAVGALTAVAYSLRMVDLHLENLVVHEGKPIIVDPECILYTFPPGRKMDRLLSTGLLSHNPGLSSLRGGDLSKQAIVQIGLCERPDGALDYQKPATAFRNRFRDPAGALADPSEHRRSLFGGFMAAFEWFLANPDLIVDILDHWVVDDFRIRYLVRKTRLYIATIHMLNLPVSDRYDVWRDGVFVRFRQGGHFPKEVTEGVVTAELRDMDARDVPFFWVNAGETVIRHRTGPKQRLPRHWNALDQTIRDIRSLSRCDMKRQVRVLADFLDADLHARRTTCELASRPETARSTSKGKGPILPDSGASQKAAAKDDRPEP